ncbi:MAG TPA: hypothetical protein VM103_01115 [Candidatus Paceibacterota bacterium]|nr:hypothetical protein [Candidatus Paceibacterota bacterium]
MRIPLPILVALLVTAALPIAPQVTYAAPEQTRIALAALDVSLGTTEESGTATTVSSEAALETHAMTLTKSDENLEAVALSSDKISLSYREPAKLFGFITLHVPIQVTVTASGEAKVHYPWYSFLMATNQAGIAVRTQAITDQHLSGEETATTTFSTETKTRLVDSLHAMLKSEAAVHATTELQ